MNVTDEMNLYRTAKDIISFYVEEMNPGDRRIGFWLTIPFKDYNDLLDYLRSLIMEISKDAQECEYFLMNFIKNWGEKLSKFYLEKLRVWQDWYKLT